jgi:hypothetical protein
MASEAKKTVVPETHENVRGEDIEETIAHLSDTANTVMPRFSPEHIEWIRTALQERRELCARQYLADGRVDEGVNRRLKELDEQINGVAPEILKVLHYLSRIRAIIPALMGLQQEIKEVDPDPTKQMVKQMKYECSKAEVQSALQGLAELHIRPKILEAMARGETPK